MERKNDALRVVLVKVAPFRRRSRRRRPRPYSPQLGAVRSTCRPAFIAVVCSLGRTRRSNRRL